MITDEVYKLCESVLLDETLSEDDKTDRMVELLAKEKGLSGRILQDTVLQVLFRHRDGANPPPASPGPRPGSSFRSRSPAPWQTPRANSSLGFSTNPTSPLSHSSSAMFLPSLSRTRSGNISPFASPHASPRLGFANMLPRSPSQISYNPSEPGLFDDEEEEYGDYGSDVVDWLVGDEAYSRPSSSAGSTYGLASPGWQDTQQSEMSPYDLLRTVVGESRTDSEIEKAFETNGYDLSATIASLMEPTSQLAESPQAPTRVSSQQVLIGKSMAMERQASATDPKQHPSKILCKYIVSHGRCLRADCRYRHDTGNHVCKYFLENRCVLGNKCAFSHDVSSAFNNLSLGSSPQDSTSKVGATPGLQIQDFDAFPALATTPTKQGSQTGLNAQAATFNFGASHTRPPLLSKNSSFTIERPSLLGNVVTRNRNTRPTSRQSSGPLPPTPLSVDDSEAFPTLAAAGKATTKQPNKLATVKEPPAPSSLADLVRNSPAPDPEPPKRLAIRPRAPASKEDSERIPAPERIPWLETGDRVNQSYLRARQDAFKHGALRNKFLQSAAQAWNRQDSRAAKALSLRGQGENELMRKAHREAAAILYEARNKGNRIDEDSELYVDLHGLHPEEAIEYLEQILIAHQKDQKPLYAITGTGHHSKNGKDRVGKTVRLWLIECRYTFREFSVPGDRGNVGGILGIDPKSFDRGKLKDGKFVIKGQEDGSDGTRKEETVSRGTDTKVRVMKVDEVTRQA